MRAQAGALLMCLLFGSLQGLAIFVSHTPDCCANGICPLHRSHSMGKALSDCDHEHGKSDCAVKCGTSKLDLSGILPSLPEMNFPDAIVSQKLVATRFEVSPVDVVVIQIWFSPPEQPPRA